MKSPLRLLTALLGVCFLAASASAETYWILKYDGVITRTNEEGKLVTRPMTDRTLVRECADHFGITNRDDLALVLHLDSHSSGDTIEVVNVNDPNLFRCEVLKLGFKQSFTNSTETLVRSFAYVYNDASDVFDNQSGHSRGSAILQEETKTKRGETRTTLKGNLQFWLGQWLENAPAPEVAVCSGRLTAKQTFSRP